MSFAVSGTEGRVVMLFTAFTSFLLIYSSYSLWRWCSNADFCLCFLASIICFMLSKSWSLISSSTKLIRSYIKFANSAVWCSYSNRFHLRCSISNARAWKYRLSSLLRAKYNFAFYWRLVRISSFVGSGHWHFAWNGQNTCLEISRHSTVFVVLHKVFCYWWWVFVFRCDCTWLGNNGNTSVLLFYFGEFHREAIVIFMILEDRFIVGVFSIHYFFHSIEQHCVVLFYFCLFVLL